MQGEHQREQLKRQAEANEELMSAIDSRVDEWKVSAPICACPIFLFPSFLSLSLFISHFLYSPSSEADLFCYVHIHELVHACPLGL